MIHTYVAVVVCAAVLFTVTPARAQSDGAEAPDDQPTAAVAPLIAPPAPVPSPAPVSDTPRVDVDRPFARLLPNLLQDLRRLPSMSTAITLGLGGAVSLVARPNDDHLTTKAAAGGTDDVFKIGGKIGMGYTQVGGAIATYVLGRFTKRPRITHIGSDLIRAQVLTGLLTHSLKVSVRRHRPEGESGSYSFPSGHASASWASATVLWRHLGWKAGIPAALVAAYSSGARLQENQHFMSDIAFGAALGIAGARTVTMGHGGPKLMLTPTPLPGGGGVFVTVLPR